MTNTTKAIAMLGVVACLGLTTLPLSSYAVTTVTDGVAPDNTTKDGKVSQDVGVTLTIDEEISITTANDTTSKVVLSGSAGSYTGSTTVTVITNNKSGYKLGIKGSADGTATALTRQDGTDTIVASSAPFSDPKALDATSASVWGYAVANTGDSTIGDKFDDSKYAGVTDKNVQIVKIESPTTNESAGKTTTVSFAAKIKDGQPAGTYNGQVTFTAVNGVTALPDVAAD